MSSRSFASAPTRSNTAASSGHHKRTPSTFAEEIADDVLFRSYRIGHSRSHTGRFVPSSKRRISWSFGLTNLEAIKYGCFGNDCRGAENEVTLVWSVRSNKTRLWWNNQDVTHLVPREIGYKKSRDGEPPIMYVEFSWQCGSGQLIRILAHCDQPPSGRQYELYIDGQRFSTLPKICDLGSKEYREKCLAERKDYVLLNEFCSRSERSIGTRSNASSRRYVEGERVRAGAGSLFQHVRSHSSNSQLRDRLASAGLSIRQQEQDAVDELTLQSDYTNSLKMIRDDLISTLPELEDMMSFAIINAFSGEDEGGDGDIDGSVWVESRSKTSNGTHSIYGLVIETRPTDPIGIEVDALSDAYQWMMQKNHNGGAREELLLQSEKLSFLQELVTQTITNVRQGHLAALEASHIVQAIATVLGMPLVKPLPKTTILLTNLHDKTSASEVRRAMEKFGPIDAIGVASDGSGFAMCRFASTRSAELAYDASRNDGIVIDNAPPKVLEFHSPVFVPPLTHVSTDNDPLDRDAPASITWDEDEIADVDSLEVSNHTIRSCELPALYSSPPHSFECSPPSLKTAVESPKSAAIDGASLSPSVGSAPRHRRTRSTAIYDGEPKTYEESLVADFASQGSRGDIAVSREEQPTSSVRPFEDGANFAEIFRGEVESQDNEDEPVHVLYAPEDD